MGERETTGAPEGNEVSIGEIIEALARRSFGSLLVIVGLLAILPTGAIPGMSAFTGALMLLTGKIAVTGG